MKKEKRNALLKELGYSKNDMKSFWKECLDAEVPFVKAMDESGLTWKDLTKTQLRYLPNAKEEYLDSIQKNDSSEIAQIIESKTFEEKMYEKICAGQHLDDNELADIVYDEDLVVDETEGSPNRWTRPVVTVAKLCGHYYEISWNKGLTEMQEDFFDDQPTEVRPVVEERIVKETKWVGVDAKEEPDFDENEEER